jgi:hypothetical protein
VKYPDLVADVRKAIGTPLTKEQAEVAFLEVEAARRRLLEIMNRGEELTGIDRVKLENDILRAWVPKGEP